ncbi:S8 family peptidase [Paenibacillus gorillae]|uniref:S8 family peptidase n=1 Tax=Paenibacillus gorillae TaxID=1243662 RepID=UPI0005AA7583|nr:S8 family peptidase [Paenibacillus gorillae]
MPRLEQLLTIHSRRAPSKYTVRKLIALKTGNSYKRCIRHLRLSGIRPFKRIPGSRLIGCHFDSRLSWEKLRRHPSVRLIEPDKKIRTHTILPSRPATVTGKSKSAHTPRLKAASKRSMQRNTRASVLSDACPADLPWNLCAIAAHKAWKRSDGDSVKIAIIDTGIAPHPSLRIAGGVNTVDGGSYIDDNGHGTHVAGIAAAIGTKGCKGVAPKVKLYAVKALDHAGAGYVSDIIDGIEWCIRNKMSIINMSFGLERGDSSQVLHNSIKKAVSKGIIVVASAGNSGPNTFQLDEPAAFSETIAVAATTRENRIANFSNRGSGIAIAAPGEDVRSTWLNGNFLTVSGTSMASPHVTGGAALLLALKPGLNPSEVKALLKKQAHTLDGFPSFAQGSGLLQLDFL